jgi:metal-responsive CopG/Arc/MetJ family transcriptional regulator
MSSLDLNRNEIIGIRTTKDFVKSFDSLCDRLGYRRSTVVRYALRRFINEHFNHPENFRRAKSEMV